MHEWFSDKLHSMPKERGTKVVVLSPRGSAKSTWGTLIFPLFCALERLELNTWIISDTIPQSVQHLDNIASEIDENEALAEAYPSEIRGATVKKNRIVFGNGAAIQALSTGQKVRGRRYKQSRPTFVVLDDPDDDEHVISPDQRAKNWNWFVKALMKAGNLRTNFLVLGTALHRECIVCRLMETAGWSRKKFESIRKWPNRMDLWTQWEGIYSNVQNEEAPEDARRFYDRHKEQMDDGHEVLWPDYESLYDLMRMRCEDGHASFESEKQNNPVNPDACEFPEEYFASHIWFDEWPQNPVIRLTSLDPSKGKSAKVGDYSAIVEIALGRDGLIYIDADLKRRPASVMVHDFVGRSVDMKSGGTADGCAIETNQFQELLLPDIEAELRRRGGFPLPLHQMNNLVNKEVRIRRIEPYLSHKRLRFLRGSPGTVMLVNQLKDFPIGDHDDGPDSLEMALRLGSVLLSGKNEGPDRIPVRVN